MSEDNIYDINWLLSSMLNKIIVPTEFHNRCKAVEEMLESDVAGIVDTLTDFSVQSADLDWSIETANDRFTSKLKNWLGNINKDYNGRIPRGIGALAQEYFKERWKGSSFPILKIVEWKTWEGIKVPSKMFFVDGSSVYAKSIDNDNMTKKLIGCDYYLGRETKEKLDKGVIITKPFSRWHKDYPNPFLIKRGVYFNWKIIESLKDKESEILSQVIPFLLSIKKGFKGTTPEESKTYTDPQLKQVVQDVRDLIKDVKNKKTKDGKIPVRATNFDEELTQLIPDLEAIFKASLFTVAERNILSGLGFIDIAEAVSTSIDKREKVLVKHNNTIKNIAVGNLDNELKKSDNLKVPTYDNGEMKWKNAKLWKHHYEGQMYRIFSDEGKDFVETTANHSIMVWKDGNLISKRADELKTGDNLLILNKFLDNNKYQNIIYYDRLGSNQSKKVRNKREIIVDEEVGYLLGFYLAEGCTTKCSVNISNTNKDLINKIKSITIEKLHKKPYIYKCKTECERWKNVYDFRIHSMSLSEWFKKNFNTGASNKEIPDIIFNSPNSVKEKFLEGYLAGDGHLLERDKIWTSSTASINLAKDLMLLAKMIGYNPYLRVHTLKNRKWNIAYIIRYTKNINRIPTNIIPNRKLSNSGYLKNAQELKEFFLNLPKDWVIKKVSNIEKYEYNDMVYDLEVEDNPTFVAGTGILVHNSRRESILNPKAFIQEVKKGVKDFKNNILRELIFRIIDENKGAHRKYVNSEIFISHTPIHIFQTSEFKNSMRLLWKNGQLSNETYCSVVGEVDYRAEVNRRKKEIESGEEIIMYPHYTQNLEDKESFEEIKRQQEFYKEEKIEDKNGKPLPPDKTEPEQKEEYDIGKKELEIAPYKTVKELPSSVRKVLSPSLQSVFRKVFNSAYEKYHNDSRAFRIAWGVIKKIAYKGKDGKWHRKTTKGKKARLTKSMMEKALEE